MKEQSIEDESNQEEHLYVERTFSILKNKDNAQSDNASVYFKDLSESHSIVVLGEPGAGKSQTFREESKKTNDGYLVSARDFVYLNSSNWIGKTLFIDGLDEMRASSENALDVIRSKIEQLNYPKFRISCRAADWFGDIDREALEKVSNGQRVKVVLINPLTKDDQLAYLTMKLGSEQAEVFLEKSNRLGLQEWLTNPQTLNLLIDAVGSDGDHWPTTRLETYQLAVQKMASEENKAHRIIKKSFAFSPDTLIECAGRISATYLLSDSATIVLDESARSAGSMSLELFSVSDANVTLHNNAALRSRLFIQISEETFAPIHRSVAEFLAAQYIAKLINSSKLPLERALALMVGVSGVVITSLRGLYAWLAVFGMSWRSRLIDIDPLGLVLYGDTYYYSVDDKTRLLHALRNLAERTTYLNYHYADSHKFSPLVTSDMRSVIQGIITKDHPTSAWQMVMACIFDGLRFSAAISSLVEDIKRVIISDSGYLSGIRVKALNTLIAMPMQEIQPTLMELLNGVNKLEIVDDDDELLGNLLEVLFPKYINEISVFDYLHIPKKKDFIASYHMFWMYKIHESSGVRAELLLDELIRREVVQNVDDSLNLSSVVNSLIAKSLEHAGGQVSAERVYQWLSVKSEDGALGYVLEKDKLNRIKNWLFDHPHKYCDVIEYAINSTLNPKHSIQYEVGLILRNLLDAEQPPNFMNWCLEKSIEPKGPPAKEAYFHLALRNAKTHAPENTVFDIKTFEFLESWVIEHAEFSTIFSTYISSPVESWRLVNAQDLIDSRKRKADQDKLWVDLLETHWQSIIDGNAHSQVLYNLALIYRGHSPARGKTPEERLGYFLGEDIKKIEAVKNCFINTLFRHELPTIAEIIHLDLSGKSSYFYMPCMVGLDLIPVNEVSQFPEELLGKLIALYLTSGSDTHRDLFEVMQKDKPRLYGSVYAEVIAPHFKRSGLSRYNLGRLVTEESEVEIAKIAVPILLKLFPNRVSLERLGALKHLLCAAIKHLDYSKQESLIIEKLGAEISKYQKVYWLCAAAIINPDKYTDGLYKFVGNDKKCILAMCSFFEARRSDYVSTFKFSETFLGWLIGKAIKVIKPHNHFDSDRPNLSRRSFLSDDLSGWINLLATKTTATAEALFIKLMSDPDLGEWKQPISIAYEAQKVLRGDSEHKAPSAIAILKTLSNQEPANVEDLFAITVSHLKDLREKIRYSPTNDYQQYWNLDEKNQNLHKPKPENFCRDALLSDLNVRLDRLGIEAIKEGYYADEKRADIKVSYMSKYHIPVEIKRDQHKDLWTAIDGQLVPRYMSDPKTGGKGIYLVFWFGGKGMPKHPRLKIKSALELEKALKEDLRPALFSKVEIIVIDCFKDVI